MTEKLALGQRGADRAAIYRHERPPTAIRVETMHSPRETFFARTGLARDEDRQVT